MRAFLQIDWHCFLQRKYIKLAVRCLHFMVSQYLGNASYFWLMSVICLHMYSIMARHFEYLTQIFIYLFIHRQLLAV